MPIVNDEYSGDWGDSSKDVIESSTQCTNCNGACHVVIRGKFGAVYCSSKCKKEYQEEKG